jgi:hypothetical protein
MPYLKEISLSYERLKFRGTEDVYNIHFGVADFGDNFSQSSSGLQFFGEPSSSKSEFFHTYATTKLNIYSIIFLGT